MGDALIPRRADLRIYTDGFSAAVKRIRGARSQSKPVTALSHEGEC
jgi:hypothetical protein